jgi:hypothetical protein
MRVALAIECEDMEPGDTRRIVCPECRGGQSGERSMNVTRTEDGILLFICYRAACGTRGAIGGSHSRLNNLIRTKPTQFKVREDIESRLEPYQGGLPDAYSIGEEEMRDFGVRYDPVQRRVALPVYSPTAAIRGWVLRAFDGRSPKTLAVPTKAEPQLCWNLGPQLDPRNVVVVEDIPSAIRLRAFGVRAVALNGTHLTDEAKDELAANAQRVVFALDRDAFYKSIELTQDLSLSFESAVALLLPRDFKNQTNNEVMGCLAEISWLRYCTPGTPLNVSGTLSGRTAGSRNE